MEEKVGQQKFRESDSTERKTSEEIFLHAPQYPKTEQENFAQDYVPYYKDQYNEKKPSLKKRSSERIIAEARKALIRGVVFDATSIAVSLEEDVLHLKGEVNSRIEKKIAEYLVETISGVSDVLNEIKVRKTKVDGWISVVGNINDEA